MQSGKYVLVAIMMLGFAVRLPNFVVFIPNHPSYMVVEVLVISVVVVTVDVIVKVKPRHGVTGGRDGVFSIESPLGLLSPLSALAVPVSSLVVHFPQPNVRNCLDSSLESGARWERPCFV